MEKEPAAANLEKVSSPTTTKIASPKRIASPKASSAVKKTSMTDFDDDATEEEEDPKDSPEKPSLLHKATASSPKKPSSSSVASPKPIASPKASSVVKKTSMTEFDDDATEEEKDPKDFPQKPSLLHNATASSPKKPSSSSPKSSATAGRVQKTAMTDFDDDSDDEDFGHSSPTVAATQPVTKNRFVDDEAADVDEDDGSVAPTATQADSPNAGGIGESTASPALNKDDDASEDEDDFDMPADTGYSTGHSIFHQQPVNLPEPQPAFAPSSTPLDLPRRFMCWNHIGSVTLRRVEQGGRNTVDINFTDSAFRRPIGFTDTLGFILGSIGEDGGIFATDIAEDDDDDDDDLLGDVVPGLSEKTKQAVKRSQRTKDPNKPTGSSLYFHRFETFGNIRDKDWYLTLPSGERALGCATGEGWAAVMTSRRFLRLFSSGGNQGQMFWLEGEPITMAGRSRFLAVFYHEGEPLRDGTQKIGYKLIDALTNRVVTKGSASCVSAGSTLTWVGFNNDGSLLAMDSEGMVSMLVCTDTDSSWEWMPMLDTLGLRKSSDDSFWPVSVYDGKLVCVPLKGGTKHPDATRRPVTASLGLRLPLARGTLVKRYVVSLACLNSLSIFESFYSV